MPAQVSRRDVLKQLVAASAGLAASPLVLRGQAADLVVAGQPVEVAVSAVSPVIARITIKPIAGGIVTPVPDDDALVRSEWEGPHAAYRAAAAASQPRMLALPGERLIVDVTDAPLTINVRSPARAGAERTLHQSLQIDAATGAVHFNIGDAPLLGFGEGGPQFDRRGATDRMRSGQGGYRLQTHGGRVPIQWLISPAGWAMYIHQPLGSFDLTGTTGVFTPPATSPLPLDLFVVGSSDPAEIMKAYAEITGFAEMIPLWSLGYLQSHRTLGGADEILSVARTFREKQLPCDALIYLGTDFTPSGWNTHNGEFTFNPKNFPDPKAMLDELHALNFKVVLHTVIEGQRITGRVSDPCTAPPIPPGRTPDNQWPNDRQVSCYWPSHKPLFDLGVDGFWPDQGDGYDAASRLARIRMYWEGSQVFRPNARPFALHRNGYAGMQRFGAFLWSGDVYSTWETLKTHVPNAVNTSLSGMPYWGTDIGGFVPTADYTGELQVRWFQFGAFCPLFRAHGRDWHLRLPWGWNLGTVGVSEVATYGNGAMDPPESELHNTAVEPICRKYLQVRYALMPYLYSAVRECTQTGIPIVRAMWLHYADDRAAVARGDQYLWGRDILVAPVVEKGATSRKLYLPGGIWFDFWTEVTVRGGREFECPVDLETMPLFVRAGAIIPTQRVKQYTSEPSDAPLTIAVFPGADGAFTMYEDDGMSFDYRKGDWMGLAMQWTNATRRLTLSLAPGSRMRPPARRPIEIRVAGATRVVTVTFTGAPLNVTL
jgi:alpha-glucosidase/alpha-D-xyloside xylohydrolase